MDKKFSWVNDNYFQKLDGVYYQEHIIYKRKENGGVERTKIIRRYYSDGDYQDSVETTII